MTYTGEFQVFEDIIQEMELVYQHDKRPWMIGFSGGKDSTLLCSLVIEMLQRLPTEKRNKTVYVVSSDTLVENPIVRDYMLKMSALINQNAASLNVKADIIYPEINETFWSKVIGLGYPTPEPPGFRWCTDRLKIRPMNKYTLETIKNNGEVVLLLGVRKAESSYRAQNIRAREIEGKILVPHNDIENAYVYNPLTELSNEQVWNFLLKNDGISSWGSDNKYLFSLYQGETLGEEQSVMGEVDKEKIPVTGNSRFGCWICTMVKEDKSLKNFIEGGADWLNPLRDYRNWILELRSNPNAREHRRRNGVMYRKADGSFGLGPFTLETRKEMLKRLLQLEVDSGLDLITLEELKYIDYLWDQEGDLTRRSLVDIYYNIKKTRLPWDEYKVPVFSEDVLDTVRVMCNEFDIPFELMSKLIIEIETNKHYTNTSNITKAFDKVLNQGWLHFERIEKVVNDEDKKNCTR